MVVTIPSAGYSLSCKLHYCLAFNETATGSQQSQKCLSPTCCCYMSEFQWQSVLGTVICLKEKKQNNPSWCNCQLGKIMNPKLLLKIVLWVCELLALLLISKFAPCMAASAISMWMDECDMLCKALWVARGLLYKWNLVIHYHSNSKLAEN